MKIKEGTDDARLLRVEKILKKRLSTRFGNLDKLPEDRVEGIEIIIRHNMISPTIYSRSGKIQCLKGCRRSLGDLFILTRFYYPDITLKEIREILFELLNKGVINSSYCEDIQKRTYHRSVLLRTHGRFIYPWFNKIHQDEYDFDYEFINGRSKLTITDN